MSHRGNFWGSLFEMQGCRREKRINIMIIINDNKKNSLLSSYFQKSVEVQFTLFPKSF